MAGVAALAVTGALVPLSATTASAAQPFTVSTEAELRAAVDQANAQAGTDTITLAAPITFDPNGTSGDLDISDDLVIDGASFGIDAAQSDRILDIAADTVVEVRNLTLSGGQAPVGENGGAIRSAGTLTVVSSTIENSTATGTGASGGAIANQAGTLTVLGSVLQGNSATRAGGAIEAVAGTTTVRSSTMTGNVAGEMPGNGGAFHLTGAGQVLVEQSEVTDNVASAEGGGLWNSGSGIFEVRSSTITGNTAKGSAADQGGGGLFNDGGTLVVTDSVVSDNDATGSLGSGGGLLNDRGTAQISSTVFDGNTSLRAGGAIEANIGTTELDKVVLSSNETGASPGNGGGLHLSGAGTVSVRNSTVRDNTASAEGGGLWNSAGGTFTIESTKLIGNVAKGAAADQGGGGLFNDGGTMIVRSSKLINNSATGASGSGGGVFNNAGTLTIENTRITNNDAQRAGGGLETLAGTVRLIWVSMQANTAGSAPGNGGALHISGAGNVLWQGGVVTGNKATNEGGGLWNSSTGTLVTESLLVKGNKAPKGANVFNQPPGGTFTFNGSPVAAG